MDFQVDITMPERIQKSDNMEAAVQVTTIENQPLTGFTVELYVNESFFQQSITKISLD